MPTRFIGAAVAALCVIGLSACSESGTPTPGGDRETTTNPRPTSGSTTTTAENDRYGAPSVENPLDATKQLKDPCSSLTADQQRALGNLEAFGSDPEDTDPSCLWKTPDLVTFVVSYIVPNKNGLADLYRGQEQGQWEYWEPTTVNGYPAVYQHASDNRSRGYCTISVGVTDQLHFSVFSRRAEPKTACDQVKEVAAAVVDTLKNGG
ncbi:MULTISPECIES: DUF3558 domain-containing protein [Actinokineospora]|uniref:DUF3558 domain-containing protein n=1 Tax=Actinokineospora fastidiosa TaxID=1816 RepID=A0A918G467_9PSEU|nr:MULTISPECIES: DUF3558 domain-containing protein [Actinokineospora]UVS76721.1 hypothetical protein Actkin_00415 [Actinokineospora sp. UTMC 2448]GGS16235.1 hypothetical protein GCM10010171_05510 [Actinokineospora fastidiosa]